MFKNKSKKNNDNLLSVDDRKHAKFESFDGDLSIFDNADHSDTNMIIFESFLNKKGKINTSWQERYCVIYTDRKLAYFRRQADKTPAGYIDLSTVTAINMYLPRILDPKNKNESKNKPKLPESIPKHQQSHSLNDADDLDNDYSNFFDINAYKDRNRSHSLNIKSISLKGNNCSDYGFELVTNKRVWIFSCDDGEIFKQWMDNLRDSCFGKALHSGYLRKTGQKYKTWRRRFFVIYDLNEIRYFEDKSLKTEKGKIELNKVFKINAAKSNKYHYQFCIELHTKERIWCLAADNKQERDLWMNGIRKIMKQHQKTFIPSNRGFLSMYNPTTLRFKKYFFAVHKSKMENRLCCFENQIDCKQLEAITCYGEQQFDLICKTKIKQIIPLNTLIDCLTIDRFEFSMIHDKCKQDMQDMRYLITVKMEDIQFYFAPHPNTSKNAQQWVNIIKNLKSTKRQNVYSKLIKLGYKSSYIGAVLEQYESAYGYKRYDFDEIKAMIDRMAKPDQPRLDDDDNDLYNQPYKKDSFATESKTNSSSDSKSATSPIGPSGVNTPGPNNSKRINISMNMQPLTEDKSFSFKNDHHALNNKEPFKVNATYKKSLSEEDYQSWSTNDILLWLKSIENGLITKRYPKVIKRIKDLKITGQHIKTLNDINFMEWGVDDVLHRALIMEAISNLQ